MLVHPVGRDHLRPWNKGLLVGQKKPLQPKHVWSIRVRLEIARMWRDLALFNLAIDSKLRACDLVKLCIDEVCSGAKIRDRTTVVQKKTGRPVQFEITEQTRASLEVWLRMLRTFTANSTGQGDTAAVVGGASHLHLDGYGLARLEPTMRQSHVASVRVFVDYAGTTFAVIDGLTGEAMTAQLVVAVLGASSFTYAEDTGRNVSEEAAREIRRRQLSARSTDNRHPSSTCL